MTNVSLETPPVLGAGKASPPIRLADTAWPMIHCTQHGTKQATGPGPVSSRCHVQHHELGMTVVIMVTGKKYLYVQTTPLNTSAQPSQSQDAKTTGDLLYAFDLDDIRQPCFRFATDASFPYVAGGVVDNQGHVWWTVKNRVVRLSAELDEPVFSEAMRPVGLAYNGLSILPDGNLLVVCKLAAHIVSTRQRNADGEFRILSTLDLERIFGSELLLPGIPVIGRPVDDGQGDFFFNGAQTACRLSYDAEQQRLCPDPVWTFTNTQSQSMFLLADPVLVGDTVWVITSPQNVFGCIAMPMQLTCLDAASGKVKGQTFPFPRGLGNANLHTLGAAPNAGRVIAIFNSREPGVVALETETLDVAWRFPLKNISEAFCLSEASGRVYIANRESAHHRL